MIQLKCFLNNFNQPELEIVENDRYVNNDMQKKPDNVTHDNGKFLSYYVSVL